MANEIMNVSDNTFDIPTGYICTMDTTTKIGKLKVVKALNNAKALSDIGSELFTVVGILTTPSVRSRTNEPCTATYLVCADGNVYFSQSDGIAKAAATLTAAFGDIIEDGIVCRIVEFKTKGGNTMKTIDVPEDANL